MKKPKVKIKSNKKRNCCYQRKGKRTAPVLWTTGSSSILGRAFSKRKEYLEKLEQVIKLWLVFCCRIPHFSNKQGIKP